jgi:hypothetical protein
MTGWFTLAEAYYCPILLTNKQTLSHQTEEEIARLRPKQIILLGSTGAISQEIEDELAESYKVIRLGGRDRYETAAAVARHLKENNLLKKRIKQLSHMVKISLTPWRFLPWQHIKGFRFYSRRHVSCRMRPRIH